MKLDKIRAAKIWKWRNWNEKNCNC